MKVRVERIEIWRPLICQNIRPGYYEISNFGRIKSFTKGVTKILKPIVNEDGYHKIRLMIIPENDHKGRERKGFFVHRLVAEVFCERRHSDQIEVNHKDGKQKTNNWEHNLEWCTGKENSQHAFRTGLAKPRYGKRNHATVHSEDFVRQVCEIIARGGKGRDVFRELDIPNDKEIRKGISKLVIRIKRHEAWTYISKEYGI